MTKRKASPAQEQVRTSFKEAVKFLQPLNGLIKNGFAAKAKRKRNFALSLAIGHVLKNAMMMKGNQVQVDPAKVLLSDGYYSEIRDVQIQRFEDRIEVLHDEKKRIFNAGDEMLTVCAYQVEKAFAFVNQQPCKRQAGKVIVPIPAGFEDDDLHLYVMTANPRINKYARSQYLGYSIR